MKIGVIDIGSNTIHYLIARITESHGIDVVDRKRIFAYIAKEGLHHIKDAAKERLYSALADARAALDKHAIEYVKVVATASLRQADNRELIIAEVKKKYGLDIEIISGSDEARYIFEGTKLLGLEADTNYLTLDIGGGSVEFIFSRGEELLHQMSLDIGISALRKKYRPCDPIQEEEVDVITKDLMEQIRSGLQIMPEFVPEILIGASGPFEISEQYMGLSPHPQGNYIDVNYIKELANIIISKSSEERKQLSFMNEDRADLSLESFLLIRVVLDLFPSIARLWVSPYAMKEGIIREYLASVSKDTKS